MCFHIHIPGQEDHFVYTMFWRFIFLVMVIWSNIDASSQQIDHDVSTLCCPLTISNVIEGSTQLSSTVWSLHHLRIAVSFAVCPIVSYMFGQSLLKRHKTCQLLLIVHLAFERTSILSLSSLLAGINEDSLSEHMFEQAASSLGSFFSFELHVLSISMW